VYLGIYGTSIARVAEHSEGQPTGHWASFTRAGASPRCRAVPVRGVDLKTASALELTPMSRYKVLRWAVQVRSKHA